MGSIVGIDEVGRGCLAGPLLVVAAQAYDELPSGLKDSKLLTRAQREELLSKLGNCCTFGEGWVKAAEIDRHGLAGALRLGAARSLRNLKIMSNQTIIVDGAVNYIPKKFKKSSALIDGDNLVPIISAASIYAKVSRDQYMFKLAKRYPVYHFESHVGYGTKTHMLALKSYGALKYVHRHSYAPIAGMTGATTLRQPNRV
jgi:ribonuclease HII